MVRRIAAVLLLLALLGGSQHARAEPVGSIRLPESMPPLPLEGPATLLDPAPLRDTWAEPGHRPLGVTLDNYNLTEQQIDAARQTGCGMVRLFIPMEHFVDEQDADWAVLDQVISRLRRANLEVMAVLDAGIPERELYRDFCGRVAARYCDSLRYYQLLDNINYKIGLTTQDYADLVSTCRPQIMLGDRDAVIVSGGIRGCDMTYLEMLENQRAMRGIDILAFNLYPPKDGIEQPASTGRAEHSLPYFPAVVDWAHARGKRVWVTALGASTDSSWVGMDQVTQASVYSRACLILGWMGAERIVLAAIQDSDPSYSVPARCCGVLDCAGQPKASFFALQSLNRAITGAYHTTTPFVTSGHTYQQPRETDVLNRREQNAEFSEQAFAHPGELNPSAGDPLDPYKIYDLPVYSFWFYAPEQREYRLIYWLGEEQVYPVLITLTCGNPKLTPFADHLRPLDSYEMLDVASTKLDYMNAQNLLILQYLPLDVMPGVLRFQATGP